MSRLMYGACFAAVCNAARIAVHDDFESDSLKQSVSGNWGFSQECEEACPRFAELDEWFLALPEDVMNSLPTGGGPFITCRMRGLRPCIFSHHRDACSHRNDVFQTGLFLDRVDSQHQSCEEAGYPWGLEHWEESGSTVDGCARNNRNAHGPDSDFVRAGDQSGALIEPALLEPDDTAAVRCCSNDGSSCVSFVDAVCHDVVTFREAKRICSEAGMRLCSHGEMETCCGTGCNFDHYAVWTSSRCTPPVEIGSEQVPAICHD